MGVALNGSGSGSLGSNSTMVRDIFGSPTSLSIWAVRSSQTRGVPLFTSCYGTGGSETDGIHTAVSGGNPPSFPFQWIPSSFVLGNSVINVDSWCHIVYVFTAWNNVTVYVDGNVEGTLVSTANYTFSGRNFYLGRDSYSAVSAAGGIAECAIYPRLLSAGNVSSLFAGNSPMGLSGGDPIAYWRMLDAADGADVVGTYPFTPHGAWSNSGYGHPPVSDPPIPGADPSRTLIEKSTLLEKGLISGAL